MEENEVELGTVVAITGDSTILTPEMDAELSNNKGDDE